MNREAIMQALLTLVRQSAGFVTFGRRLEWIQKVAGLPAAYVIQIANAFDYQEDHGGPTMPPIRSIGAEIWIYAETDPQRPPGVALNPLLDAVEAALQPEFPGGAQTLGGLVSSARIVGKIEVWEGHASERAAAIIPVRIVVP